MIKKILIYVLIVIVLIVAGAFVFGLLNPSVSYETKLEIDKPRDVVWKYFTDETKMGEWLEGFQKFETISGKTNEVGSKFRLYFIEDGNEVVLTETLTAFRVPELFAMRLEHEIMTNDVEVTFSEENGKTIMVQKENAVGANILWRIMFAAMKSNFQDRAKKTLEKLKANVEKL